MARRTAFTLCFTSFFKNSDVSATKQKKTLPIRFMARTLYQEEETVEKVLSTISTKVRKTLEQLGRLF